MGCCNSQTTVNREVASEDTDADFNVFLEKYLPTFSDIDFEPGIVEITTETNTPSYPQIATFYVSKPNEYDSGSKITLASEETKPSDAPDEWNKWNMEWEGFLKFSVQYSNIYWQPMAANSPYYNRIQGGSKTLFTFWPNDDQITHPDSREYVQFAGSTIQVSSDADVNPGGYLYVNNNNDQMALKGNGVKPGESGNQGACMYIFMFKR